MGSSQSTEKKSPVKESAVTESPVKESSETAKDSTVKESPTTKDKSPIETSSNSSPKADEIIVTPKLEKEIPEQPQANTIAERWCMLLWPASKVGSKEEDAKIQVYSPHFHR